MPPKNLRWRGGAWILDAINTPFPAFCGISVAFLPRQPGAWRPAIRSQAEQYRTFEYPKCRLTSPRG